VLLAASAFGQNWRVSIVAHLQPSPAADRGPGGASNPPKLIRTYDRNTYAAEKRAALEQCATHLKTIIASYWGQWERPSATVTRRNGKRC
jgi:hypothetical protein